MWGKHNGNIFETFGASLVVLGIESVKSHFTKPPLATMMFLAILSKINRVLLISNINDCLDLESTQALNLGGGLLKNKMADIIFFPKSCPP